MRIVSVFIWLWLAAIAAVAQLGPTEQRVLTRLTATAEAGKKESKAAVLGKPLSGVWAHFATPEAKKALGRLRGSWIWRP